LRDALVVDGAGIVVGTANFIVLAVTLAKFSYKNANPILATIQPRTGIAIRTRRAVLQSHTGATTEPITNIGLRAGIAIITARICQQRRSNTRARGRVAGVLITLDVAVYGIKPHTLARRTLI